MSGKRSRWRLSWAAWRRLAVLALILGHLIWIISGRVEPQAWSRVLNTLAQPMGGISARWKAWRHERAARISKLHEAEAEVQRLRSEVARLQTNEAANASRIVESGEAVRLLGLKQALPMELKAARVIANLRQAPFGGMVLDQGWDAGLVPDQGVICPEGVVGRIWSVSEHQASLLPLDAYNASTAVMLARSRATGVLQGVGPGMAEVRYVSVQEVVQVGEAVLTSGLDRVFPRGMLVGWITKVQPHEMELRIEVSLAAPLDRVHQVLILSPKPDLELKAPGTPSAPTSGSKRKGER